MTLHQLLADDLLHWMDAARDDVPRRVLLWPDPEGTLRRLAQHLEPVLLGRGVRLLRYRPDGEPRQLPLRVELLRLEAQPQGRAVVYLPGSDLDATEPRPDWRPQALWSVYEYRAT